MQRTSVSAWYAGIAFIFTQPDQPRSVTGRGYNSCQFFWFFPSIPSIPSKEPAATAVVPPISVKEPEPDPSKQFFKTCAARCLIPLLLLLLGNIIIPLIRLPSLSAAHLLRPWLPRTPRPYPRPTCPSRHSPRAISFHGIASPTSSAFTSCCFLLLRSRMGLGNGFGFDEQRPSPASLESLYDFLPFHCRS